MMDPNDSAAGAHVHSIVYIIAFHVHAGIKLNVMSFAAFSLHIFAC